MVVDRMGQMNVAQLGTYLRMYLNKAVPVMPIAISQTGYMAGLFPVETLSVPKLEYRGQAGVPGRMNVALDTPVEDSKWEVTYHSKEMKWDKFAFSVTDAATDAVQVNSLAADGMRCAVEYFAALRDYKIITELKAKNSTSCTATAAALWTLPAADIVGEVTTGISKICEVAKINPDKTQFNVLYPAKCMAGLNQLGLIGNVQQTIKGYLQNVFNINFIGYAPWHTGVTGEEIMDVKHLTDSDALGTSALIFVGGPKTLKCGQYLGNGITLNETTRIHDVGYKTTLRNSFDCMAIPYFDETTETTPLVYELGTVST